MDREVSWQFAQTHTVWHICPHESVTTSLPRDGVGTVRQSLRGSSRSICQNPSTPASWQHPLLPPLVPLLPAGLGIRNVFWRYISMGVHLHSAWGHRWWAADRGDQRGTARFILSFCHFVLPLPLLSPQTMNSSAKNWIAASSVVKRGCWITVYGNCWKKMEKGCGEEHNDGLRNRAGSGKLRVLSCSCMFFINNDIIRFVFIFWNCEGRGLKGIFPIHILSSQKKWNFGCHLLFLPIQNESVIALNSVKTPLRDLPKSTFSTCVFWLPG